MGKTGTLTFHAAYNFGSCLQAYALQLFLSKYGYNFEIINYRPKNQHGMYSLINLKYFNKGVLIKNIYNIFHFVKVLKRNKNYSDFIKKYYTLSNKSYLNDDDLSNIINEYSVIICGSDQIWNLSSNTYDRSLAYFLELDKKYNGLAIAYAPSFGDTVNNLLNNSQFDINYLKKFKFLSFRESDVVDIISKMGYDSTLVADPTLLLNKEDWEKLIGPPIIKKPYIFYYSLNCKKYSINFVKKISEETGLPIVSPFLHPRESFQKIKICASSGPIEFLNLLYHSTIVCSNSFHGTVFSIIFEKDFYAIFDEDENKKIIRENRKASLLENLELSNHISSISNYISIDEIKKTDYKKVKEKIKNLQKLSSDYLLNAIKEGSKND